MRFDDIPIDEPITIGSHQFTREAILAFAREFDPQPFHVDEEAARASHYGGLIASGWHTVSAWMRLTVDYANTGGSVTGISPGRDEIVWSAPVRPGDVITYTNRAITKRRLASRPGWAMVASTATGVNQDGVEVLRMAGPVMVRIED